MSAADKHREDAAADQAGPGTRASVVLILQAAATQAAELEKTSGTDAEVAEGLVIIGHAVQVAGVHAQLAIEARLGQIADRMGELVEALNKAPTAIAVGEPANITFVGDPGDAVERARKVFDQMPGAGR